MDNSSHLVASNISNMYSRTKDILIDIKQTTIFIILGNWKPPKIIFGTQVELNIKLESTKMCTNLS